jgi:hypothetical protein
VPNAPKSDHGDGAWSNNGYADVLYQCDLLINVPLIRLHEADYGGVTVGFKNHNGTYVSTVLHSIWPNAQKCLSEYNSTGPIYLKTMLTVICALQTWGPSCLTYARTKDPSTTNASPNTIVVSTDPVTADFQAIKIIRVNESGAYGANDMPNYLKCSAGITGIYSPTYNIGVINEGQMDARSIVNGTGSVAGEGAAVTDGDLRLAVYPNPARSPVTIEYTFPGSRGRDPVYVGIYDSRGRLVQRYTHTALGVRNSLLWDGSTLSGGPAATGAYVVKAEIAGRMLVNKFTLVR